MVAGLPASTYDRGLFQRPRFYWAGCCFLTRLFMLRTVYLHEQATSRTCFFSIE